MNQFKNGTLLAVAATVVTAVLILMTDRNSIDTSTDQNNIAVVNENSSQAISQSDISANKELKPISYLDEELTEVEINSLVENVEIDPPEGPFSKSAIETTLVEINANQQTELQLPSTQEKTDTVVKLESNDDVTTLEQHEILNHIVQPIWMDQKLGDFKSLGKSDIPFKIMPSNPNGLQGENPNRVVTKKNDKFGPLTVSADYNYQQMPMYNGGYYIAPMPSYLMSSKFPEIKSKK